MSDIFNEVDEELRRQRLKDFWNRYQIFIIGAALIIILGVGGWRGYEWWQAKRAAESGAVFESAVALAADGKYEDAEKAFGKIADENTAYRVLARLRQAGELARRDRDGAVKIYDALVAEPGIGVVMQDLARVRGAQLLLDTATAGDMKTRLSGATEAGRVFRHTAREILAFASWRAGDAPGIKQWFDTIIADTDTPPGVRTRVEMLMSLSPPEAKS